MKRFGQLSGYVIASALLFAPFLAQADTFKDIADDLVSIMNLMIPVILGAALLVYFWHIIYGILNDSKKGQENFKKIIPWGIIALFVLVSVWGIISLLQDTIFTD